MLQPHWVIILPYVTRLSLDPVHAQGHGDTLGGG